MKRKIHPSWILALASVMLLFGVVLSFFTAGRFVGLSWLIIGLSLLFVSLLNRRLAFVSLAIAGGLLIGLWRGSSIYPSESVYKHFTNKKVEISGVVSEDVAYAPDGSQQIKLKNIKLEGSNLKGQIWVSSDSSLKLKRSDHLGVYGKLSKGFGSFSAAVYSADITRAVRIRHGDVALEIRDRFSNLIRQTVKEPQASLGIGFLTGQHANLPQALVNSLRILGLTHIIVASGYNLTILVRFARRGLMRVSKYTATLGSALLITGFIMVTGSSPSMVRAGLITGLSLGAWYYGRRIHPMVLIPFSAALTVLFNPSYLHGDLGWYLSFAAFVGVIILSPLLFNYFWGKNEPTAVMRVIIETLSAQILTAPIIAFSFGQFAPFALLANVLILPLIPFAMIFTFVAGLAAILPSPLALLFGLPAQALLNYMTFTTDKLANLPGAQGEINFTPAYLLVSYIAVILFCVWLWRRTKHDFSKDSLVE